MSLESFSRLSQSIKDAAEATSEEAKTKAQKAATLVVNSVGVHPAPKRTVHPSEFSKDTEFLGNALKAARETKQPAKPEAVKSLAELLAESAAE
jgi:hypothetical protein